MLIPRKQGGIPRIVTDFRYLNSRLKVLQCSIPLVRDAIQQLGAAGSEIVTIFDFRDAFHTLRIALLSQKYLGITPYYGSPTYIYQRLGMGLSISPSLFMHFITQVLYQIEYCYIVGLGLNCKFIDLLFKCSVLKFIKISSFIVFIVSEIIYSQTDTLTLELMELR